MPAVFTQIPEMNLYLVEDFVPLLVLTDDQQAFPKDLEFPSLFVFFFFLWPTIS